jgi:hypothetical protein
MNQVLVESEEAVAHKSGAHKSGAHKSGRVDQYISQADMKTF